GVALGPYAKQMPNRTQEGEHYPSTICPRVGRMAPVLDWHNGITFAHIAAGETSFVAQVVFTPSGAEPIEAVSVRILPESSVVSFEFAEALPTGFGILSVDYVGTINDQMAGFYRSSYTDLAGKQRYMGTTFFALIHA
ncbi:hypothetical protein FOZ63_018782, partial [Perkinsus olseni]